MSNRNVLIVCLICTALGIGEIVMYLLKVATTYMWIALAANIVCFIVALVCFIFDIVKNRKK